MPLPPRPAPMPAGLHLVRLLGWMVLFEYLAGVAFSPSEASQGALVWLALAVGAALALGFLGGFALDRVHWLARRPEAVLGLGSLGLILLGWAVDDTWVLAGVPALCAALAWVRWRFPGRPGRGRTAFRLAFFGLLLAGLLFLGLRARRPWRFTEGPAVSGRSVLLVVLDTVRRDHLSTYGYARDTAPNLSALAARGAVFYASAHACWSLPGHGTLLTGRYAGAHGAHYEGWRLRDGERTLAAAFAGAGYDTLLVTANPWLRVDNGLAADFGALVESWDRTVTPGAFLMLRALRPLWDLDGDKGGAAGARALGRWLDARPDATRPFFALVNVMEAHAPYHMVPREHRLRYLPAGWGRAEAADLGERLLSLQLIGGEEPDPENVARAVDLYDGAVRAADDVLGRLIAALASRGLAETTLVVVTADHGEYLGEHGLWGHVHGLYQPVLEVPLVLAGPDVPPGTRRAEVARLIDVAPTVLAAAGVGAAALPAAHGRVLGEGPVEVPILAEQYRPRLLGGGGRTPVGDLGTLDVRRFTLQEGDRKVLVTGDEGHIAGWVDLAADPGETPGGDAAADPAARAMGERLDALRRAAGARWEAAPGAAGAPVLDEFSQEALRALGYL